MATSSGVTCALVYPPLSDPTCGYHSLSYLAAAVRERGRHEISVIDANIEAVRWCARAPHVRGLQAGLEQRLHQFARAGCPDLRAFLAYRDALVGTLVTPDEVESAVAVLRDPVRFWRAEEYRRAATTLERWLLLLATSGEPGMFRHFSTANIELQSPVFLTDAAQLERLGAPFRSYFQESLIPKLAASSVDVVGIGVTYRPQLPFALYLVGSFEDRLPIEIRVIDQLREVVERSKAEFTLVLVDMMETQVQQEIFVAQDPYVVAAEPDAARAVP